jgi:hypothetical protein
MQTGLWADWDGRDKTQRWGYFLSISVWGQSCVWRTTVSATAPTYPAGGGSTIIAPRCRAGCVGGESAAPELANGQRRRFRTVTWILGSRCLQEWLIGLSVCVRVFTAAATTIIRSISTGVPLSSRVENFNLALCSPDDEPILT